MKYYKHYNNGELTSLESTNRQLTIDENCIEITEIEYKAFLSALSVEEEQTEV